MKRCKGDIVSFGGEGGPASIPEADDSSYAEEKEFEWLPPEKLKSDGPLELEWVVDSLVDADMVDEMDKDAGRVGGDWETYMLNVRGSEVSEANPME
jgi:hypothetical protein